MARGILVELLSRPDGWETTADAMWRASVSRHGKASPGRRQFRAAFAELKEHGYLTADREHLSGGRHATVLTLADVPQAGTPVPPGETHNGAGHTDVPHAGTSDDTTDVPHGGTPDPPAETGITAGRTDVPPTDVPPCGTSLRTQKKNTEEKNTHYSSTSADGSSLDGDLIFTTGQPAAPSRDYHLEAFGAFWLTYPKRREREDALAEWKAAIDRGADPERMVAAATAYARERAGEEPRFTKMPATWLRKGCYDDEPDPEQQPNGRPNLRAVNGGGWQPWTNPPDDSVYTNGW